MTTLTYSNPRLSAEFTDWPWGSQLRTTCTFTVENSGARGQRVVRVVIDPRTSKLCAPKKTTYGQRAWIVDGSDGKTYVITLTAYQQLYVMQSNLQFQQECIDSSDQRHAPLLATLKGMQ